MSVKTANLLGQEADEQCHGVYEDLTGTSRHTLVNKPPPWVSVVRAGSDVVPSEPRSCKSWRWVRWRKPPREEKKETQSCSTVTLRLFLDRVSSWSFQGCGLSPHEDCYISPFSTISKSGSVQNTGPNPHVWGPTEQKFVQRFGDWVRWRWLPSLDSRVQPFLAGRFLAVMARVCHLAFAQQRQLTLNAVGTHQTKKQHHILPLTGDNLPKLLQHRFHFVKICLFNTW